MRRPVIQGMGQTRYEEIAKVSPRPFGQLTRRLIHEGSVYEVARVWPPGWHATLLGDRVMGWHRGNVAFHRPAIALLTHLSKLEDLGLLCDLLRAEREVFRVLREGP